MALEEALPRLMKQIKAAGEPVFECAGFYYPSGFGTMRIATYGSNAPCNYPRYLKL